jgi:hypothetical protein
MGMRIALEAAGAERIPANGRGFAASGGRQTLSGAGVYSSHPFAAIL